MLSGVSAVREIRDRGGCSGEVGRPVLQVLSCVRDGKTMQVAEQVREIQTVQGTTHLVVAWK